MFYIDKSQELTPQLLHKIILKYTSEELPRLKRWKDYYDGRHKILRKAYNDASKPCNKIIINYCKIIADTYAGYIAGKPLSYTSNDDIADIQEAINYNDSASEDIEFLTNALVYGQAYELFWLDSCAQVRYCQVNPTNCFAVYDNSLDSELLYFVRWYDADMFDETDVVFMEVYDSVYKHVYKAHGINGQLVWQYDEQHHFNDVPVSVFNLNNEKESIFEPIISLNDAYNELQSSEVDDYASWVDAYLLLTNVEADAEDVASMKEQRVLCLPEGSSAQWLTKNASDTQIENMLAGIRKNIFKITACPDMGDENFLAQSGTALAYKLTGFENKASGIVARMSKAIQRRIELICNIIGIKGDDAAWRDVNVNFIRNLPVNLTEILQIVNALKGTVSDATLLSQLPFVTDVASELEAVRMQKEENMAVYGLGTFTGEDDEDEEAES